MAGEVEEELQACERRGGRTEPGAAPATEKMVALMWVMALEGSRGRSLWCLGSTATVVWVSLGQSADGAVLH